MGMPKWNRITIDCYKYLGGEEPAKDKRHCVAVYGGNGKILFKVGQYASHKYAMETAWRTFALFVMDPSVERLVMRGPMITDSAVFVVRPEREEAISSEDARRLYQHNWALQIGGGDAT